MWHERWKIIFLRIILILFLSSTLRNDLGDVLLWCFSCYEKTIWLKFALGSKSGLLYTKIILPKICFNWKNMTQQYFIDKIKSTQQPVCVRANFDINIYMSWIFHNQCRTNTFQNQQIWRYYVDLPLKINQG